MYKKYAKIRDSLKLNDSKVATMAGISRSTLSEWKSGKHQLDFVTLQKIADALSVSISSFTDEPQTKKAVIDFISDEEKEMNEYIEKLKNLSPKAQQAIFDQIDFQNTKENSSNA